MQVLPLSDEPIWLQRLAAGDPAAFGKIFTHYWDTVYSTAFVFTKSPELAEDLTQDVFAQVWIKRETLPHLKNFSGYLFMMARNAIYDQLRKNVLSGKMDNYLKLYFHEETGGAFNNLETKELEERIRQAMQRMPPKQQQAFRLSRFEGWNHEQIAREMNISRLSVKNYIVKSLLALRQFLNDNRTELAILMIIKYFFPF